MSENAGGERRIVIEELYPEFGNQGGDNGNLMYLRACLPEAEVIQTAFGDEPAFVSRDDVSMVLLGGMTEHQQVLVAKRLGQWRERLAELVDRGVCVLFTGNAAELLGTAVVAPDGTRTECLGLFDFVARQNLDTRYLATFTGVFEPGEGAAPINVCGFKAQFTQMEGENDDCCFCRVNYGFGLREGQMLEGFRRNNCIATWVIGPILPSNPDLTRWFLDRMGATDASLAFEDVARLAYEKRWAELNRPGLVLE